MLHQLIPQLLTRRGEAQQSRKEARSSKSEGDCRASERSLLRHSFIRSFVILWVLGCFVIIHSATAAQVIGKPDFIHLEKDNGVWWLADHAGKRFITTGMNHIGEGGVLFNEVNKEWLTGEFGADIKGSWGGLNPRAKGMGGYADMVVKDFKDHAFNTIPFHAYSTPLHHYEERKIYYVAKIKVQNISLQSMNRARGHRFPDVCSEAFRNKLDALAKRTCTPLRDAKYCLGYSYFDMPDLKPMRPWQRQMFPDRGLVYPWVQDMRSLPADAAGKQAWMRILKQNHASASAAAEVYALNGIASWDDLANVTDWPIKPNDVPQVKKDAEDMLIALADKWYGLHHELIRKYDPNHLLLGDKHDVGYDKSVHMISDGILNVIGKSKNTPSSATKSAPDTVAEMFASLKLTTEQQAKFEEQEKDHRAARARFRDLKGEALRSAQDAFYSERKKKLQKIFTEEQWGIWSSFWNRTRNR